MRHDSLLILLSLLREAYVEYPTFKEKQEGHHIFGTHSGGNKIKYK